MLLRRFCLIVGTRGAEPQAQRVTSPMTNAERAAALTDLYQQIDALITADEFAVYDPLTGLGDLINDLELEVEE